MSVRERLFDLKKATVLRDSSRALADLRRTERLDPTELQRVQDRRAAQHAKFAMTHTTFYRDRYHDAGFRPDDLDDPAAFAELPTVSKSDVRDNHDDFVSSEANAKTAKRAVTGGSTGEPLALLRDLRFQARALEWRLMDWWGVSPADDQAIVYRKVRVGREATLNRLLWWPARRFQLDAMAMTEVSRSDFFRAWSRVHPRVLIGYVGAVTELATLIVDGTVAAPHPPDAIAVTAAPLNPNQRQLIGQAFRAPVYDHYRSAEVPWIAGECARQEGLHVFADVRRLEILDPAGAVCPQGTLGEVVLSDLTNRVFPLLRYRIGDRTRVLRRLCGCGVTLPLIEPVGGRQTEVLHLPSGRFVAGEGLSQLFRLAPEAVRQFQIHQRSDYSIDLLVVPGRIATAEHEIEAACDRFRVMIDHAVPIRLRLVDTIPHEGGKVRYLRTDLAPRS